MKQVLELIAMAAGMCLDLSCFRFVFNYYCSCLEQYLDQLDTFSFTFGIRAIYELCLALLLILFWMFYAHIVFMVLLDKFD